MGDPRRLKKKYSGPAHPWQRVRIQEEKELVKEYCLKNKKELWKANSKLKNFANQAKKLIALRGLQAEKEAVQLLNKLERLGMLEEGSQLNDVLGLTVRAVLERRLQTLVCKKGLARTLNQSRQFIVHRHILVDGKKITAPSYLVPKGEENITFVECCSLSNVEHPERVVLKKKVVKVFKDDKEKSKFRKERFPKKQEQKKQAGKKKRSVKKEEKNKKK